MKVSIVCGVYNAELYLEKCIKSMLNQTYKNIEIILIVNSSIDASENIVRKFERKYPKIIKAFYTEKKLGAGGSRQFGLEHASGDYVCFVDCDDILKKDYISNMVNVVCRDSENPTDIVICFYQKISETGKLLYVRKYKNNSAALVQSVAPWGKMFRKQYLDNNNLILRNIPFGEDVIFSAEIYLTKPNVKLCKYIGYIWRNNLNSTSHTELGGFPEGTFEKSKEYFEYMTNKYVDQKEIIDFFMYKYYIWYLLQSGRKVSAISMEQEYNQVFCYLHNSISNLSYKNVLAVKGERPIVSFVMIITGLLDKLHLSRWFFIFYSQSFLGRFWPNL